MQTREGPSPTHRARGPGPADPLEVTEGCWPLEGSRTGRSRHTPSVGPSGESHPRLHLRSGAGAPGPGLGTGLGHAGLGQSQLLPQKSVGRGGGLRSGEEHQALGQHNTRGRATPVGIADPAPY